MNQDPFKKEHHLRTKLNEYHIEVPEFPMKPKGKGWYRLINILASPAKNPVEPFISTTSGFIVLKIAPILGTVLLTFIQLLLIL